MAVNPYLGQTGETLAETGARLGRVAGVPVTMPRAHYAGLIGEGTITDQDILDAIAASADAQGLDLEAVKRLAGTEAPAPTPQPTVADLAAQVSGLDWPGIIADRFGLWAAGYFDQGQALWAAPRRRGAYDAWRQFATHDLTPEIAGLKGFAQYVSETPDTADEAKRRALDTLGLPEAALETYLHKLLFTLGGWGQVGRYHLWQAELAGGSDDTLTDLLTIRLLWEEALFKQYEDRIAARWADVIAAHEAPVTIDADFAANAILQEAWERAVQRQLAETFAAEAVAERAERPALQVGFCIDVRSEVYRRALESLDPSIQTIGFAGFFGLTAAHKGFASDVEELRLPVLLNPGVTSTSQGDDPEADLAARFRARASRAWGRFKLAAVSSFAFVEATGPIYVGKLVRDALHMAPNAAPRRPGTAFRSGTRHRGPGRRGRDDPARHVADREFRAAGHLRGPWRQRGQQPLRQRPALRRLRRLFGRGERAPSGGSSERGRCARGAARPRHRDPRGYPFHGCDARHHDRRDDPLRGRSPGAGPCRGHQASQGMVQIRRQPDARRTRPAPAARKGPGRYRAAQPRLGRDAAGMGAGRLQGVCRRAPAADRGQEPSGPRLPA